MSKQNENFEEDYYPFISVLFSAYNEEKVIEEKIRTTLNSSYPSEKFEILIGSDCSDDRTNEIVEGFLEKDSRVKFYPFFERSGKPTIINELVLKAKGEILVLTDADTFFERELLTEIIKPFRQKEIGGVQAMIHSEGDGNEEVLSQELMYNKSEFRTKMGESSMGAVMGAHGACYALRKELYVPVPIGFAVDDFFIFMNVLKQGFKTIFNPSAKSTMLISGSASLQFKRKRRMGAGNYRNLFWFKEFINPFKGFVSYAFFSHKFLRWVGPFLLMACFVSALFLSATAVFWKMAFVAQIVFYGLALIDLVLRKIGINVSVLRAISHFVMMNFAFLLGFFNVILKRDRAIWHNR